MNVTLPDGTVLTDVPDGATQTDILKKLKANDHPAFEPMLKSYLQAQRSPIDKAADQLSGAIGEPAVQLASGAYHAAVGGLKGIADIATGKGVDKAVTDIEQEESKTYQPRTAAGKTVSGALAYLPKKQTQFAKYSGGKAADIAQRLGASPEVAGGVGATVDTGIQSAGPGALLKGFRGAKGAFSASRAVGPVKQGFEGVEIPGSKAIGETSGPDMVQKARAMGYVLKPSEAGAKAGRIAEGLAGSPKFSAEASIKNQKTTNIHVAEDLGILATGKITKGALTAAMRPHNEVYKAVSELGDFPASDAYHGKIAKVGRSPGKTFTKVSAPDIEKLKDEHMVMAFNSKDAVLEVRRLRARAVKNIKAPNAPAQNELGFAERQVSDAIEDELERRATEIGHPDLVSQLQKSRRALAKIHTARAALVSNDISARKLSQMQDKGVPLDGKMKDVADIAAEFAEVNQPGPSVKNKTPITVLEGALAIGAGAFQHPAFTAGVVARPATRQFLMSDYYQNKLAQGPRKAPTIEEIEANK